MQLGRPRTGPAAERHRAARQRPAGTDSARRQARRRRPDPDEPARLRPRPDAGPPARAVAGTAGAAGPCRRRGRRRGCSHHSPPARCSVWARTPPLRCHRRRCRRASAHPRARRPHQARHRCSCRAAAVPAGAATAEPAGAATASPPAATVLAPPPLFRRPAATFPPARRHCSAAGPAATPAGAAVPLFAPPPHRFSLRRRRPSRSRWARCRARSPDRAHARGQDGPSSRPRLGGDVRISH